jgi:hypothetical protein
MKVYKSNPLDIDMGPLSGMIKPLLAGIVVVALVLLVTTQTSNVLHAQLMQNPLFLSQNDSTILSVLVTNPENVPVNNVVVSLYAPGSTQLSVYPAQQTIQTLGPQEVRKLEYLVSPVDSRTTPFLPGTYRVDVSTQINGKKYQTSVMVNVEK